MSSQTLPGRFTFSNPTAFVTKSKDATPPVTVLGEQQVLTEDISAPLMTLLRAGLCKKMKFQEQEVDVLLQLVKQDAFTTTAKVLARLPQRGEKP